MLEVRPPLRKADLQGCVSGCKKVAHACSWLDVKKPLIRLTAKCEQG